MFRGSRTPSLTALALLAAALSGCAAGASAQRQALADLDRGRMYDELGLSDAALQAFAAALDQNSQLVEAALASGDVYRLRGDYDQACRAYARAIKIAPDNFDAHYELAVTWHLLGELARAVHAYQAALALNPYDFNANCDLAAAYLQMQHPAEALPYARQATQVRAQDPGAWANLGAICTLLGQYAPAAEAYGNAAEHGAPPAMARLAQAEALIHLERYDQAAAVLHALVQTAPGVLAYDRLGYANFKARQVDPALAAYQAALALDPDDIAALNGVGVCLMTNYILHGQQDKAMRDQALDSWRKSLRLRPDQTNIVDLLSRYQKT